MMYENSLHTVHTSSILPNKECNEPIHVLNLNIQKKAFDNSYLENFRCDGNKDNLHSTTTLKSQK